MTDSLTLVSEQRLRELLRIEKAAKFLREGVDHSYHHHYELNLSFETCELCRVVAFYDKEMNRD